MDLLLASNPLFLLIWFLCAVTAGILGAPKGIGGAGFLAGLLFGPLGLLLVLFSRGHRRPCQHCRELIHRKATICPHCGRETDR
jgi:hypothetical protein